MTFNGTSEYFRLSWRPIPIEGKKPFLQNWEGRYFIESEFEAARRPNDNVGLVCGRLNDNYGLVAIDVDQPEFIGFNAGVWLEKGAMAHTTSTGPRLVFYTDCKAVWEFSRKVQKRDNELTVEERSRLNKKAEGKEAIVILEVLAMGRQFMAPPSIHPETGQTLRWISPPRPPQEALVVHDLEELKVLLGKSVTRNRWVLEDLFETAKAETTQNIGILQDWLKKIRARLDLADETQNYLRFHCPFHGPDKNPSFVIHKTKFYGHDYHDDKTYNLKQLAKALGIAVGSDTKGGSVLLSHLNMIEDPTLADQPFVVEAVVSSTSVSYLAPVDIEATIEDEDGSISKDSRKIDEKEAVNIQVVGVNEGIKYKRLKRLFGSRKDINIKEKTWRAIYRVRVRPPVFTLEKRGDKIVDEAGYEYKVFDIYVTADKPITFQPSSLIKVEGLALPKLAS